MDLEKMLGANGTKNVGGVGDVALRHFKDLKGFEQYRQYYVKREDAQIIFEKEVAKRSSRFAAYIDVRASRLSYDCGSYNDFNFYSTSNINLLTQRIGLAYANSLWSQCSEFLDIHFSFVQF